MIRRDYLIVGAGAAGIAAAEAIRSIDKRGSILLVGAEPHPGVRRPELLRGMLGPKALPIEKLLMHDAAWFHRLKVDLRLNTVVTQFSLEQRAAVLATGQAIQFGKALLATGSRARRPEIAGANLGNVFYLRSAREIAGLREVTDLEKSVVVVGGGLVGAETASLLRKLKANVTMITRSQAVWTRFLDPETAVWFTEYLAANGVKLMLNEHLNGFEGRTVLQRVQTKSGQRIDTAMAIVAVGSEPNLQLVQASPLWSQNGCPVTERLESDELGIFAAGDIALYPNPILGGMRREEHWDAALAMGRAAGLNMATRKKMTNFSYIPWHQSRIFDLVFDFIGDFTRPPTRVELDGDRAKKRKFTLKCYQLNKLTGVVCCNAEERKVKALRADFAKLK
jgi:3-phenylpropionate/trans-cinnamate dioxygenase ferredoxin reductase component